ncbi:MAG: pilin [Candidatus Paceibacteria bacterium]
MSKKITGFILGGLLGMLLFTGFAHAQLVDETDTIGGLVPCGNIVSTIETDANGKQTGGKVLNPCNFNYFIMLINKLINFLLFRIFVPLAAIMFCYAGFLLLFSGGNSEKMQKAKGIFFNVVIGLVFAAGAWLIIHTISEILGYDGSWIGF